MDATERQRREQLKGEIMNQYPEINTTAEKIRLIGEKIQAYKNDDLVSFEFIMTALFPDVYNNIIKFAGNQFNCGYAQGLKDAYENQRNN